jgi:hypothetical protein
MKNLFILLFCASFVVSSCRKTRTCSCSVNETVITVTTPRNGGDPESETQTSTGTQEFTNDKMTKTDMVRFANCTGRTETSSNTYTTMVFTPLGYETADVKRDNTTIYDCEIK